LQQLKFWQRFEKDFGFDKELDLKKKEFVWEKELVHKLDPTLNKKRNKENVFLLTLLLLITNW
jgi:hypothetical protein